MCPTVNVSKRKPSFVMYRKFKYKKKYCNVSLISLSVSFLRFSTNGWSPGFSFYAMQEAATTILNTEASFYKAHAEYECARNSSNG